MCESNSIGKIKLKILVKIISRTGYFYVECEDKCLSDGMIVKVRCLNMQCKVEETNLNLTLSVLFYRNLYSGLCLTLCLEQLVFCQGS